MIFSSTKKTEIEKELYLSILRSNFERTNYEIAKEVLTSLSIEITNDPYIGLKPYRTDKPYKYKPILFDLWVERNFIKCSKLTAGKLIYLSLIKNKKITLKQFIISFREFFISEKLNLIFRKIKKTNQIKYFNIIFKDPKILTKMHDYDFKNCIIASSANRIKCSRDEAIRLISAYVKYKECNNRLRSIENDLSYGFFRIRNVEWIRQKGATLRSFFTNYNAFADMMDQIRAWEPASYNILDRKSYLKQYNITMNLEVSMAYIDKLMDDANAWYESEFSQKILVLNSKTIISSFINENTRYDGDFINSMNKYSIEYDNKIIKFTRKNKFKLDFLQISYMDLLDNIDNTTNQYFNLDLDEIECTTVPNPLKYDKGVEIVWDSTEALNEYKILLENTDFNSYLNLWLSKYQYVKFTKISKTSKILEELKYFNLLFIAFKFKPFKLTSGRKSINVKKRISIAQEKSFLPFLLDIKCLTKINMVQYCFLENK